MAQAAENAVIGMDLLRHRVADYGGGYRPDVIELLPEPIGRVLDIGCGSGNGAQLLRDRGATEVVGVELDTGAAARAQARYDHVLVGSAEEELPWAPGSFDTVLCYDVLEHLYDPWSLLKRIRTLLASDGKLHISVPNVRNRHVLLPLLFCGRFTYVPDGLLDITHIRFFTRAEIVNAVNASGFLIQSVDAPRSRRVIYRAVRCVTRDMMIGLTSSHWFVLATPRSTGTAGSSASARPATVTS